jgi:hypothetical protein
VVIQAGSRARRGDANVDLTSERAERLQFILKQREESLAGALRALRTTGNIADNVSAVAKLQSEIRALELALEEEE